jgi:Galactose oxidase, central domain
VEVYDPSSGRWLPDGDLTVPRYGHTATLLKDGRIVMAGGIEDPDNFYKELSSSEICG